MTLVIYTIYRHPDDYPRHFVVRPWDIVLVDGYHQPVPRQIGCLCKTLYEARQTVPPGLTRMPRTETDLPTIVETWI